MTMADLVLGFMIACGFFLSAAVGRLFRRGMSGVLLGGVVGLGFSVTVLVYGLTNVFTVAPAAVGN